MAQEKDIIIDVKNLHKYFYDNHILKGIDFSVKRGELIAIIGKSGCGKTTLLRCLNLLEFFNEGTIMIAGITINRKLPDKKKVKMLERARNFGNKVAKPFSGEQEEKNLDEDLKLKALALRKRVGMLFQSLNLFPHLTALENIILAPEIVNNMNKTDAVKEAKKLLEKVEMLEFADRLPSQLSGGQAQRVAIARALALNPQVMLYDEPTSALDPELVQEVIKVMNKLHDDGMTQIVVTHAMSFARHAADRVFFMDNGEIVERGTPDEIFNHPKLDSTKKYIKILGE